MTTIFRALSRAACVAMGLTVYVAGPAHAQDSFGEATQRQPMPQQFPQQQFPGQQGQTPQQFPQQQFPGQQEQPPSQFPPQQFPPQQPMPPAGGFGEPPSFGQPPPAGGAPNLDQLTQAERQDYGVPATPQLHAGQMHGPTPASIPGGQVVTTKGLTDLMRGGQVPVLVLDVLGGPEIIQGAQYAVPSSQAGTFNDQTQQQFGQYLQQVTGGNKQYAIVTYCLSTQCWMSYNAALRAINLGYTNVLWYRGGIEAWKQAGMPTQRAQ